MPSEPPPASPARKAGVLGKPVRHSLSPVLHNAAYQALGLTDWHYSVYEVDAEHLPGFVGGLGAEWAGLSVTMPGKRAALEFADEASDRATVVGAANTLVPWGNGGWRADCTDIDGVAGAFRATGAGGADPSGSDSRTAVVLGAGGTAAAAMPALAGLGVGQVRLVVREPERAVGTSAAARAVGLAVTSHRWAETDFRAVTSGAAFLVNTVPPEAVEEHTRTLAAVPRVLDVIYHPWPTPLAEAVLDQGGRLATGLDMLLHQSFGQVEQFTGRTAPRAAMREALWEATGGILPLPLD